MSNAHAAHGTLLQIGDGATPTEGFTTIAEVKDIDLGLAQEPIEVTNHSSTDGWRERIGGLLDGGEVTFEVNFLPADDTQDFPAGLLKDMVDRTKRNFKVVFTDTANTEWLIPALVSSFEPSAPVDGALTASVTLTAAGKPTLA